MHEGENLKPHRKSIRLKDYDYTTPMWYYITICTINHKSTLCEIINGKTALSRYGKIVKEEWLSTKAKRENIDLDYYVITPNHFHGIIIIESRDKACLDPTEKRKFGKPIPNSLSSIIGSFKSAVTKRVNESERHRV